jgi:hypothetical protein
MSKKKSSGTRAPEREQRMLTCKLTDAELLERGDQMAAAELKIDVYKITRKEVSAQISAQSLLRGKLAAVIDAGKEERAIDCTWIEDFAQNCYRLVRQDTGEQVDTRPMVAADRQASLAIVPERETPPATVTLIEHKRKRKSDPENTRHEHV